MQELSTGRGYYNALQNQNPRWAKHYLLKRDKSSFKGDSIELSRICLKTMEK